MLSPAKQKEAHRMARKAAGLCIYCDNATEVHLRGSRKGEHKLLCQECMTHAQRRLAGYRAELSAHHLCLLCRKPTSQRTSGPRKGEHFLHCDECRAYVRTVHRNNSPTFGQCRRGRQPSMTDFILRLLPRRKPMRGCPFEDIAEGCHIPLRIVDAFNRSICFAP